MPRRIETESAKEILFQLIRKQVESAAREDRVLVGSERDRLSPFLEGAARSVRDEKSACSVVWVDEVVDRAMEWASIAIESVNPSGGLDGRYLSREEVRMLAKEHPELGKLAWAAYELAQCAPTQRIVKFLEQPGVGHLLKRSSRFGTKLDIRLGQPERDQVPVAVQEAFDHAHRAEEADWGSATLTRFPLGGRPVFAVHLATDGDDGHVEVFSERGHPVISGRMHDNSFLGVDDYFGLSRYIGELGFMGPRFQLGLSEDDEREVAGQIPKTWQPEAWLSSGTIGHDGTAITRFEVEGLTAASHPFGDYPQLRCPPADSGSFSQGHSGWHLEVARLVIELMFTRSLQFRADGQKELRLSDHASIAVGKHRDPKTGEQYLVGDYRDIDNDSTTFYFQRSASGVLVPKIIQANG